MVFKIRFATFTKFTITIVSSNYGFNFFNSRNLNFKFYLKNVNPTVLHKLHPRYKPVTIVSIHGDFKSIIKKHDYYDCCKLKGYYTLISKILHVINGRCQIDAASMGTKKNQ